GVGGLAGDFHVSTGSDNYSTGNITTTGVIAGGLVGDLGASSLIRSYATGDVSGHSYVGGLVGYAYQGSSLSLTYATGNVRANSPDHYSNGIGGLVGMLEQSTIDRSYATGNVYALNANNNRMLGGLVGWLQGGSTTVDASITRSFATGRVDGRYWLGGLVGYSAGKTLITDSFATGRVVGSFRMAGFIGELDGGTIQRSFSIGWVTGGGSDVRGFAGRRVNGGTINSSYWATDRSTRSSSAGGTGRTYSEMLLSSNYTGWARSSIPGSQTWTMIDGALPSLRSMTVDIGFDNKTYDGLAYQATHSPRVTTTRYFAGQQEDFTPFALTGSVTASGAGFNAVNAGTYDVTLTPSYTSSTHLFNYNLATSLTIDPRVVSVALMANDKTYDGLTAATGSLVLDNVVSGDDLFVTSNPLQFASAGAGNDLLVTASGLSLAGAGVNNYSLGGLSVVSDSANISKALLTVNVDSFSREYGDANPAFTSTITGFKNNENASVIDSLAYSTSANQFSNVGSYAINALASDNNYNFVYSPGVLSVNKALLNVTVKNTDRFYGDSNPAFTSTITGFKNNENASVINSLVYNTQAGLESLPGVYSVQALANANNYQFQYNPASLTIKRAPLSISLPSTLSLKASEVGESLQPYYEYSGFKLNDSAADLLRLPTTVGLTMQNEGGSVYQVRLIGGFDNKYQYQLPFSPAAIRVDLGRVTAPVSPMMPVSPERGVGDSLAPGRGIGAEIGVGNPFNPTQLNLKAPKASIWNERDVEEGSDAGKLLK
ncbi:MAG: MBG domain-containing protein, partial [Limnobacter sp.]|nr:MBG domain-containing protein [Limnobacter sp.]